MRLRGLPRLGNGRGHRSAAAARAGLPQGSDAFDTCRARAEAAFARRDVLVRSREAGGKDLAAGARPSSPRGSSRTDDENEARSSRDVQLRPRKERRRMARPKILRNLRRASVPTRIDEFRAVQPAPLTQTMPEGAVATTWRNRLISQRNRSGRPGSSRRRPAWEATDSGRRESAEAANTSRLFFRLIAIVALPRSSRFDPVPTPKTRNGSGSYVACADSLLFCLRRRRRGHGDVSELGVGFGVDDGGPRGGSRL